MAKTVVEIRDCLRKIDVLRDAERDSRTLAQRVAAGARVEVGSAAIAPEQREAFRGTLITLADEAKAAAEALEAELEGRA